MKGNIILSAAELETLRKAILYRFRQLTGESVDNPDSIFNSNLKNYKLLYQNINEVVSLSDISVNSTKPLASIFHFSKSAGHSKSFRKKFIDALYKYAFDRSRHEQLELYKKPSSSISTKVDPEIERFRNIRGFWECYFYPNNTFKKKILNNESLNLHMMALTIDGMNIQNAKVNFYVSEKAYGTGTVEVYGGALLFRLENSHETDGIDNFPSFLIIDCGGKKIEDYTKHVEYGTGLYSYRTGVKRSIKAVRCLMLYPSEDRLVKVYNSKLLDLKEITFKESFTNEIQKEKFNIAEADERKKSIRDFFMQDNIINSVNIFEYQKPL